MGAARLLFTGSAYGVPAVVIKVIDLAAAALCFAKVRRFKVW